MPRLSLSGFSTCTSLSYSSPPPRGGVANLSLSGGQIQNISLFSCRFCHFSSNFLYFLVAHPGNPEGRYFEKFVSTPPPRGPGRPFLLRPSTIWVPLTHTPQFVPCSRWCHSYRPMCTHDCSQFHEKGVYFESMFANTNVRDFLKKGFFSTTMYSLLRKRGTFCDSQECEILEILPLLALFTPELYKC